MHGRSLLEERRHRPTPSIVELEPNTGPSFQKTLLGYALSSLLWLICEVFVLLLCTRGKKKPKWPHNSPDPPFEFFTIQPCCCVALCSSSSCGACRLCNPPGRLHSECGRSVRRWNRDIEDVVLLTDSQARFRWVLKRGVRARGECSLVSRLKTKQTETIHRSEGPRK